MNTIQLECVETVLKYQEAIYKGARSYAAPRPVTEEYQEETKAEVQQLDQYIQKIAELTKGIRKERASKYSQPLALNQDGQAYEQAKKEFKKGFKHELLSQIKYFPESFDAIVKNVTAIVPNPGVCMETYIYYLWDNEYFEFENVLDPKSKVYLLPRAERYLEQEANLSFKTKKGYQFNLASIKFILRNDFGLSTEEINEAFKFSRVEDLFKRDSEMAQHDSNYTWAKYINDCWFCYKYKGHTEQRLGR